jgi:hypothetical protein
MHCFYRIGKKSWDLPQDSRFLCDKATEPSRPVMELLYLYLYTQIKFDAAGIHTKPNKQLNFG